MRKFCVDCEWCRWENRVYTCENPKADDSRDDVTGEDPLCSVLRRRDELCGHSGRWWEAK